MPEELGFIGPSPLAKANDIVFLIHGTFSSNAKWIDHESIFAKQIQERIPGISVRPFRWSGKNSHAERLLAADELAKEIKKAAISNKSYVHLIAHSHGGNVALLATRDEDVNAAVASISFMGTPFFSVRPRNYTAFVRFFSRFIAFHMYPLIMLLWGGLAFLMFSTVSAKLPEVEARDLGILTVLLAAGIAWPLTKAAHRFHRFLGAEQMIETFLTKALADAQTHLSKFRVVLTKPAFVAWVEGDEARLWLSSLNEMSNLPLRMMRSCLSIVSNINFTAMLTLTFVSFAATVWLYGSHTWAQYIWAVRRAKNVADSL
jgi:hypothetical protein